MMLAQRRSRTAVDSSGRYKGFHEYAKSRGLDISSRVWLDVMIDGAVLIAFVCSTIAIMAAHKVNRLKKLLNLHASVKGRHIGTQFSGMDLQKAVTDLLQQLTIIAWSLNATQLILYLV
ncbi:galactokinase-like [Bidens hawaiensis]|uniref:galactokinase-like n=1 Tax=Bidens hawaiensis TaxID=980011 RepID=UPI00404B3EB8